MILLTGTNLNKRHEELNSKVKEAIKNEVNFKNIKDSIEYSDVDKLFKIDLASKYKNIDYVLEILKSGDSLYISRALKCDWIVDDEFAQFINPQYLEVNIFPLTPLRMKKKILSTISMRLRNCQRAEEFHHYCMRNRMYKIGMHFLLYTNETFKVEILTLHPHVYNDFNRNPQYVEHFIGNSFLLAKYYLDVLPNASRSNVLYKLRYLYAVSEEKYLDLLEAYQCDDSYNFYKTSRKLSRDIMKKHKKRVLEDPWLYIHTLELDLLVKYSTSDDAKVYAVPLLPKDHDQFWYGNYYGQREFFLKLIPLGERFSFIKKIFDEKYPNEPFEDDYRFYTSEFYEMMTDKEKEDWALRQIASKKELHGCGNDYIWYRFVNFRLALIEVKKYIIITTDPYKRREMLNTLEMSAKTEEELTELFDYYYKRHVNELSEHKRHFINNVIEKHNMLKVGPECWTLFEKILYSLETFYKLSQDYHDYQNDDYRVLSLIYYVIHEKTVPEVLEEFIVAGKISVYCMRVQFTHYMESSHSELIFKYLLNFFSNHVEVLINTNIENKHEIDILKFLNEILDMIVDFKKSFQDVPKSVRDYIMREDIYDIFKDHSLFRKPDPPAFCISDIMHYLKQDSSLVIKNFSEIKEYFEKTYRKKNVNWLIQKLKIYFSHDVAPQYLNLLTECLSVKDLYLHTARVVIYGIFNLSQEKYKIDFLKKHVPVDSKIDHPEISVDLLTIQKAICSVACHSRPPLPLPSIREYIKGDYLQHCVPIFDSYLANLPPAQCLCFVESLLDCPISIQKYGLRLAFRCFSADNLKNLVLKAWKNTKNVSLRNILYKSLFDKVNYYHDNLPAQWELFGALNILTHNLHQDDDEQVFSLLTQALPPNVIGQHLQSAYIVVSTFPERSINYERLTKIVSAIENNLENVSKNILLGIIESHINDMLEQDKILKKDLSYEENLLIDAKWSLIKTVIMKQFNVHIVYLITDKIKVKWYKTDSENNYLYRRFYTDFIDSIERLSYSEPTEKYSEINNISRIILHELEGAFPHIQIYMQVLKLKLNILTREVLATDMPINVEDYNNVSPHVGVKNIFSKHAHEINNLLKEYLDSKKFFPSFCGDINYLIHDVTNNLKEKIASTNIVDIEVLNEYMNNNFILLCSLLSTSEAREIHLFVMNFLPQFYNGEYNKEYIEVINRLKALDDDEINYFLCNKLYSSVYEHRDFMP